MSQGHDNSALAELIKRERANLISNAVLQHLRLKGKRVAFDENGNLVVQPMRFDDELLSSHGGRDGHLNNNSNSLSGSLGQDSRDSSLENSDEEDADDEGGDEENENYDKDGPKSSLKSGGKDRLDVPGGRSLRHSQLALLAANLLALKRFRSYPHSSTSMGESQLLEGAYFSHQNSQFNLPEFNKRPLTDTPIVSGVASPETREQSESESEDVLAKEDKKHPKNISHLSLADLNAVSAAVVDALRPLSGSISPKSTARGVKTQHIPPLDSKDTAQAPPAPADPQIKPDFTVDPVEQDKQHAQADKQRKEKSIEKKKKKADAKILAEIKENLLQDIPPELQHQFEKSPSLEQLKSVLLLSPFHKLKKAYTLNIPGQTSSKTSPDGRIASVDVGSKLVIVMVGLPARGKSYITNKLTRYLNWLQHDCRVFNVGNTRRMDKENVLGPAQKPLPDTNTPLPHTGRSPETKPSASHMADFFNPENKASNDLREKWAMDTLDNLLNWVLDGPGSVGILDATNSTKKRRIKVLKRIQERSKGELKVLFMESICSDPAILDTNIRLKLSGPDYKDMDPEVALKDFVGRLKNYERAYETIDESEEEIEGFQYIKMIDVGKKVVSFNVQGFLASQTVYFLLNFNLCERQIWLTRHGESTDNLSGRIGGDASLTKRGQHFSKTLTRFLNYQRKEFRKKQLEKFSSRLELRFNELVDTKKGTKNGNGKDKKTKVGHIPTEPSFCVWTSMLIRAVETGSYFDELAYHIKAMRMLNELGGGKFEGMTYDEIKNNYPKEFEGRIKNKLTYRYPGVGGESYLDVLVRLRPVINEIERTTDHLLILSHRVVLRVLLAYFLNLDKSSIVDLDVPLHTLYCLELKPYGTEYAMYEYDEQADWFKKVEPEHQKNVREVGVNFRERKYSVIPTAPPSSSNQRRTTVARTRDGKEIGIPPPKAPGGTSLRKSISLGGGEGTNEPQVPTPFTEGVRVNSSSSRKLADLNKMRKPGASKT